MNTLVEGSARLARMETERESQNPMHWMPVPMAGLSVPQLEAFMQEVDKRPYNAPLWVQAPQRKMKGGAAGRDERDPKNPMQWMPLPMPVVVWD